MMSQEWRTCKQDCQQGQVPSGEFQLLLKLMVLWQGLLRLIIPVRCTAEDSLLTVGPPICSHNGLHAGILQAHPSLN